MLHSDALATAAIAPSGSARSTAAFPTATLALTAPTVCRPSQSSFTAIAAIAIASTVSAVSASTLALAPAVAAAAIPPPTAVSDERGPTLLDRMRTCRPLPILVWRSGFLLQAGPSHGRSRLRLRREGL